MSRFGSISLFLGVVSLLLLVPLNRAVDRFDLYDETDYDKESVQHFTPQLNRNYPHYQRQRQQQDQQQEHTSQQQLVEQHRQQYQQQLEEQQRQQQRQQLEEQQRQQLEEQNRQKQLQEEQRQEQLEEQRRRQVQLEEQQRQQQLQEQQRQRQLQEQQRQEQQSQEQQRQQQLQEQQRQRQLQEQALQHQHQSHEHPESQFQSGPTYRPKPKLPATAPEDPNVIFVPRIGSIRGRVPDRKILNHDINAFLGIKYGSVRPGLGRFQKADEPRYDQPDDEIIDATREPNACPQFPDIERIESDVRRGINVDDCLTLNIYAPSKPDNYPVIVFIHGEMLFDGSAEEGQPDYFLEHGVVLVSVNYRLAPFGFLSTLTDELPGNVALADIQMSLEWVRNHIHTFGGNREDVTLLGQAGGATLVHALSLSGKAQGLFHKLILQSGTALNPYFIDESPLETFRAFARASRCPVVTGLNLPNAIACVERLSTPELLTIFKRHWEENEALGLRFAGGFKLVIGDRLGYLPQHPAAMVSRNTYPVLAGTTKDAGAFIMSRFYQQLEQVRTRNISDYIDVVLKHTAQPRHHQIWKQWALREIFTAEDLRNPSLSGLAQGLLELVNLILYRAPLIDSIRYTSQKYQTFLYVFDYRGEFHRFGFLPNPLPFQADATLSDDNIYLFPYPHEVSQLNTEDRTMARTLTTKWFNFVQFGIPILNSAIWPNVSSEYGPFVRFTKSQEHPLELDYHFGDGIPIPNLYPEYFTTTTTTTTTTPRYPNYPTPPTYPNYPSSQPNYAAHSARPSWRAHETVLGDPNAPRIPLSQPPQQRYPGYSSYSARAKNVQDKRYRTVQG